MVLIKLQNHEHKQTAYIKKIEAIKRSMIHIFTITKNY